MYIPEFWCGVGATIIFELFLHNANLRYVFSRNLLRLLATDIFVFLHLICDDDIHSVHFSEIPGDIFLCFGEWFSLWF